MNEDDSARHGGRGPFHRSAPFACIILILTTLCFALNHVIGRGIHDEVPPVGLAFWRWLVGAAILLPFVARELWRAAPTARAHLRPLSFLGCIMVGSTTLMLVALNFTTAINVSLVNATQPAFTVLLAWMFRHERLRPAQILGVTSALAGVLIMISRGQWQAIVGLQVNGGDFVALAGMLGFAVYAINIHKLPSVLTASQSLFLIIVTGCVALAPFYAAETLLVRPVPFNARAVAAIVTIALLLSLAAMYMWNAGNQILGPSRAAMFINLVPVFGATLAIVFLGETLHPYHVIGAALIASGIFLVVHRRSH